MSHPTRGWDARAYWAVDLAAPYTRTLGEHGFFPYSPAAALLASLFQLLPWTVFFIAWWAVMLLALAYLAGNLERFVTVLAFPAVAWELVAGNIHLLMAVAIVVGFRYPAAWALIALTKVTPCVGLLWFAVRREWRSLGVALGATAIIAAASWWFVPNLWGEWLAMLRDTSGTPQLLPLWLRLPLAVALVVWGALTDRYWTVPVAATLALPVLWSGGLSMLVAAWTLKVVRPPERKTV
ncbi:MAG TPA: glycosyltransferase family 87 protein [Candidatus Limnocylindria bacterium]|nr:glycosyltransferase family 87 protein [Candidatus Limnocylindria bacterium]